VTLSFYLAYAIVVFAAFALVGILPGFILGLIFPQSGRRLLLPAVVVALAGWMWIGWIDQPYGITRTGLVLYAAVGAAGFVRGWLLGIAIASRIPGTHARVRVRNRGESSKSA
jgi:hypothetical protein